MSQGRGGQNCLTWMRDEQKIHEKAEYGENLTSVQYELESQVKRTQLVNDFSAEAKTAAANQQGDDSEKIKQQYSSLNAVSSKRLGCLEDIAQIAGLENAFGSLSVELAQRATTLVTDQTEKDGKHPHDGQQDGQGIAIGAQNCILAVEKNWSWMGKLVKCTELHLQYVKKYHQFFHEVHEYGHWMPVELRKARDKVSYKLIDNGDRKEAGKLLLDLKELLTMFLHWQGRMNKLFDQSKTILPVHLRTHKLNYFRPVVAICDYRTKDINIRENEELLLTDNSKPQSWTVRNMHNTEATVPSVVCLIPGPDPAAVDLAVKLRLQLLGIWATNIKRIGRTIIAFLLMVLRELEDSQKRSLRALSDTDKGELLRIVHYIRDVFLPYWSEYDGFKALNDRMEAFGDVVTKDGNATDRDATFNLSIMDKFSTVDELLKTYREYWRHWQTYKILVETSQHADMILIVEKWQQLQYIGADQLRKIWNSSVEFSDEEQREWEAFWKRITSESSLSRTNGLDSHDGYGMSEVTERMTEETITEVHASTVGAAANGEADITSVLSATKETAETDQFTKIEQEEKKTFVITGVIDPSSGREISMQEAIMLGIIDNDHGEYVNRLKGERMPIPVAMSQGHIKVLFTSTKRSAEKRSDVGLITITTEKESRPYTVKAVIDATTELKLSIDEAVADGILNQKDATYKNTMTNTVMSLSEALDLGYLIVEFDQDAHVAEPEIITRTYAIHAVVNQKTKSKVTFAEAIKSGILDKATGAYYHNVTNENIYVGDAIRKGFIKATVVKDPKSMDIDPENRMVVQKINTIKKKLLNPLKAMAAMKRAANSK